VFENEIAVLIGTGIGVTPWASILRTSTTCGSRPTARRLRRVEFIWVCKDTNSFEWFQALLSSLEAQSMSEPAPTAPTSYASTLLTSASTSTREQHHPHSVGTDKDR